MAQLSRRAFIQKTSVGLAAAAAVTAVPLIGGTRRSSSPRKGTRSQSALPNSSSGLVAHITDRKTGEIHIYLGEQEIIHHDRALVSQLLSAAKSTSNS